MSKKLISRLLVVCMLFCLSACGNKNAPSDADTSIPTQSEIFVKPENYTSVFLISINPQFKLYLDANNNVLAVESINDDAKSFAKNIDFENKSFEIVIKTIVAEANENGFINGNTIIDFEITEQKEGITNSDILTKAVSAAQQKATELKIKIKTRMKGTDQSQTTESNTEETQVTETSKPTITTKPEETTPIHKHSYSAATCTAPQKCSCGETKGLALGHKWQEATCKTPKTCSVCKATEGELGNHKYTNGKCAYCDKKEIINPKTGLRTNGNYYKVSDDGDGYYTLVIYQFRNSFLNAIGVYSTNEEWKESEETIIYKGKTYYPVGFGGPLPEYTLTDTEIIVKYSSDLSDDPYYANVEYRLIVNFEYDLEVTYSTDGGMFQKGDLLDLVE